MWDLLFNFTSDALNDGVKYYLVTLRNMIGGQLVNSFFIEETPGLNAGVMSAGAVSRAFDIMYGICALLLVLKLLWKGFNVYILWRNGDPEAAPGELLIGACWSLAITAAFPLLYKVGISFAVNLGDTVINAFIGGAEWYSEDFFEGVNFNTTTPALALGSLVFFICYMILYFKLLGRGCELLVFRLGVPLAAIGLVNSDGGVWTNYIQMLIKQVVTGLVQYFFLAVGLVVFSGGGTGDIVLGFALEIAAFSAPKMLSQVMFSGGGRGAGGTLRTVAMAAKAFVS